MLRALFVSKAQVYQYLALPLMFILGLNGGGDPIYESRIGFSEHGHHDTAAVLLKDGEVIAAIEEERLNRIKHTNKIWAEAVRFCLKYANKALEDIDYIAIYSDENILNESIKQFSLINPAFSKFSNAKELIEHFFIREFNYQVNKERLKFVDHHTAHAAASYYMSGFQHSLVLTIDGLGDNASTKVFDVKNKIFTCLLEKKAPPRAVWERSPVGRARFSHPDLPLIILYKIPPPYVLCSKHNCFQRL